MSALPPKADIRTAVEKRLLMTLSGHRAGGYPFSLFGCGLMNIRFGCPRECAGPAPHPALDPANLAT